MHYLSIEPTQVDSLKKHLKDDGWILVHQDAGQNHFVGWGYIMHWEKKEAKVWLNYSDKQGKVEVKLGMNPSAQKLIDLTLL